MNSRQITAIVAISLVAFGAVGTLLSYYYISNVYMIPLALDGGRLQARLYIPRSLQSGEKIPGVVVCHGYTADKSTMIDIAIEIASRGMFVLTFDFRGHGQSLWGVPSYPRPSMAYLDTLGEDVTVALTYLRSLPQVNTSQIGLVGHSMGANTITRFSYRYPELVNATVAIGTGGPEVLFVNETNPPNLLIVVGLFDLITEASALNFLHQACNDSTVEVDELFGTFSNQTARKLVMPPTDHLSEISNDAVIGESIKWLETSFYGSTTYGNDPGFGFLTSVRMRGILSLCMLLGVVLGILVLGSYLTKKFGIENKSFNEKSSFGWKILIVFLIIFLCFSSIAVFLSFPGRVLFPLFPVYDGNAIVAYLLSYSLLGCGSLMLYYFLKRKEDPLEIKENILFESKTKNLKAIGVGISCWGIILAVSTAFDFLNIPIFIGEMTFNLNTFLNFAMFLPLILPYVFVTEIWLRDYFQAKFHFSKYKEFIFAFLVNSVIMVFGMIPMVLLMHRVGLSDRLVPLLLSYILGIYIVLNASTTWFFIKTRNIIVGSIFTTLFMAWFLATMLPVMIP